MSLETWKKEFYPVEAWALVASMDECMLEHALLKWRGLTKENLESHGGRSHERHVEFKDGWFCVDTGTCALCQKYYEGPDEGGHCEECPIMEVTGYSCEEEYTKFFRHGDPWPMIQLLEYVKDAP